MFQAALTVPDIDDADSAIWTCTSIITGSCRFSDDDEVSECVYVCVCVCVCLCACVRACVRVYLTILERWQCVCEWVYTVYGRIGQCINMNT